MKFLFYLTLASLPISGASAETLTVQLPNEQIALEYTHPVRLHQVLSDATNNLQSSSLSSYPIANQLFNLKKEPEAHDVKISVLNALSEIEGTPGLKISTDILIEQIKRWDIGHREFVSLDLDMVRDYADLNPRLLGEYELLIPHRQNRITIEGLVFSPKVVDFSSTNKLSDLLNQVQVLSTGDDSYAWIIYPDGYYKKVGYAYWNNEESNLAPGSVVFIGFDSETPELKELEQKIVKLISMRKKI